MRRWMLVLIFLVTAAQVVSAQVQAVIRVSLVDAAGAPVSGAEVRFRYESGADGGACVTGDDGTCEIAVESPPPAGKMIRGYLEVVGAGKRSLIWPGGPVEVPLRLKADGTVDVATETIGGEPTPTVWAPGPGLFGGGESTGPGGESGPGVMPTSPPLPGTPLPETPGMGVPAATATVAAVSPASLPPTAAAVPERSAVPEGRPRWMWVIPAAVTASGIALLVWGVRKWRAVS